MEGQTRQVVEQFGQLFESLGSGYNMGRCFGLGLVSNEPLSQADFVDVLDVSQSVVSTTLRTMLTVGMLEKVRVSGSRAQHYQVPTEAAQLMVESPKRRIQMMRSVLDDAARLELGAVARDRVVMFAKLYGFLDRHMKDLLEQWEKEQAEGHK